MKVHEIFESEQYHNFVSETIAYIDKVRQEALNKAIMDWRERGQPLGKPVFRSNSFSILDKMGMLNPERLTAEYLLIAKKESKLSVREREWIQGFVRDCIMKTVLFYDKQAKENKQSNISTESAV